MREQIERLIREIKNEITYRENKSAEFSANGEVMKAACERSSITQLEVVLLKLNRILLKDLQNGEQSKRPRYRN